MRSNIVVCLSVIVLLSTLMLGCGASEEGLSVPIKVENADNLGGIALSLQYDSSVLEVTGIRVGALASSRTGQFGKANASEVQMMIATGKGISGDGTLAVVNCRVLNTTGSSTLTVQVLEARSAETGELVETQVSEGSFSEGGKSVVAPVITFGT